MKILVTGANGLIGRAAISHFENRGADVVGLGRGPQRGLCSDYRSLDIATDESVAELERAMEGCDALIHAAAVLDKSMENAEVSRVNCYAMHRLLHLARKSGVAQFVYLSGVSIIGQPRQIPITEEHPVSPGNIYHASKFYGEFLCQYASQSGLLSTILRITAPVGPLMPPGRLLATMIENALSDRPLVLYGEGSRRQNYVDVRDIASAIEKCISTRQGGIFNIGGMSSISNKELAETCIRCLGSQSVIEYAGKPDPEEGINWEVSIAKARKLIGYEPALSIEDSILGIAAVTSRQMHPR